MKDDNSEEFIRAVKKGNEEFIAIQKEIADLKASGEDTAAIGEHYRGTLLDGLDIDAIMAADTLEKRIEFWAEFLS